MSKLLLSGKVGNIQLRQLQEQRKQVISRWDRTGLLEGLAVEKKGNIAQLLENQASYLIESTQTADVMGFDIVAFPMVRRVFSRLVANELVSVQSMNLPSGLLFYLDAKVTSGPVAGVTSANTGSYTSVYDSHYGNMGWENSFGVATTVVSQSGNTVPASRTQWYTDITVPYTGGVQGLSNINFYVIYNSGASATTAALVVSSGLSNSQVAAPGWTILPQTWTQDLLASNQIAVRFGTGISATTPQYLQAASACSIYSSYTTLEGQVSMAEVKLVVSSVTVQVKTRKMRTSWTPELAQDLAAYHSIDAEQELTALLSEELAAEIDREIIRDLINIAPFQTSWQYNRAAVITRPDGVVIPGELASGYITQKEYNQTLITQINKISALIHKATLRGGANWILCSTEVGSVLEDIEKFHAVNMAEDEQFNMGIENVGSVGSRYKVFKDPYLPDWVCLIGHKGSSFLETGYIYAPYIPFQLTPTVLDPNDLTPRKGIMTRYAKKCVNNRYYGLIRVIFPDWYAPINYNKVPV